MVDRVDVGGKQGRRQRIGAREEQSRDVEDVGGEARGCERPHELRGRDEHLAAQVAAFLL